MQTADPGVPKPTSEDGVTGGRRTTGSSQQMKSGPPLGARKNPHFRAPSRSVMGSIKGSSLWKYPAVLIFTVKFSSSSSRMSFRDTIPRCSFFALALAKSALDLLVFSSMRRRTFLGVEAVDRLPHLLGTRIHCAAMNVTMVANSFEVYREPRHAECEGSTCSTAPARDDGGCKILHLAEDVFLDTKGIDIRDLDTIEVPLVARATGRALPRMDLLAIEDPERTVLGCASR